MLRTPAPEATRSKALCLHWSSPISSEKDSFRRPPLQSARAPLQGAGGMRLSRCPNNSEVINDAQLLRSSQLPNALADGESPMNGTCNQFFPVPFPPKIRTVESVFATFLLATAHRVSLDSQRFPRTSKSVNFLSQPRFSMRVRSSARFRFVDVVPSHTNGVPSLPLV